MKINNFFYYPSSNIFKILLFRLQNFFVTKLRVTKQNLFFNRHINKTKKLKDTKKNKRAFIFANGPSLKNLSAEKINKIGYDVFVINKFIDFKEYINVKPNFYVLSDPGYFDLNDKNYKITEKVIKNKDITLFIPFNFLSKNLEVNNVYGFCDIENHLSPNTKDIIQPRGYLSMTAYKALSIALYLGYSEIFISGFDNNQILQSFSDKENNLLYKNIHFYEKDKDDADFIVNIKSFWPSFGYMMYTEHFLFTDLDKFSQVKESKIINLDDNSLVTSFSKKHILDIYISKKNNLKNKDILL